MTEIKLELESDVEVPKQVVLMMPDLSAELDVDTKPVIPEVDYSLPNVEEMRSKSELYKFELLNRVMEDVRERIKYGSSKGATVVVTDWFPTVHATTQLSIYNDRLYSQEVTKITSALKKAGYEVEVENHEHNKEIDKHYENIRQESRLVIRLF